MSDDSTVSTGSTVDAMMAADEASRALGIELVGYGDGWARTRMTVRPDMVNGHAVAHGGLIFCLADTAFACACNSWGPPAVAAAAEIVFVASARAGDVLTAEAAVRTRFGRSGVYDITVRRGDGPDGPDGHEGHEGHEGHVIAEFRGRSQQLRTPPADGAS